MALIKCPECSNDVSDAAAACPKCGHPIAKPQPQPQAAPMTKSSRRWLTLIMTVVVIGMAVLVLPIINRNSATTTTTTFSAGNPAHDRLLMASPSQQSAVLSQLLESEGCGSVTRVLFRGQDNTRDAYWSAACTSGHSYEIRISANATGSTTILDCAVSKAVADDCWTKF
jgi:hypothetical protein